MIVKSDGFYLDQLFELLNGEWFLEISVKEFRRMSESEKISFIRDIKLNKLLSEYILCETSC